MKRIWQKFFFNTHPLWGLVETALVGIVVMFVFHAVKENIPPLVFGNGVYFLCAFCGMWAVVRIRPRSAALKKQILYEILVAAGVSLVVGLGLRWVANTFQWTELWDQVWWGSKILDWLSWWSGVGYLLCRGIIRLYLFWNTLRRQKLMWSLTHAHLLVVLMVTACVIVALFVLSPYGKNTLTLMPAQPDPLVLVLMRFILTIFPTLYLYVFTTLGALVLVLPPSLLFSFLFIRWTAGRLDDLTKTTAALRLGNYQARVEVKGEDEVAQLQSDFNEMAERLEENLAALQQERDRVADLLKQRSTLTATVSHELRTPVAIIRSRLETLREQEQTALPDAVKKNIDGSIEEVLRLQHLIDDLFVVTQADAGGLRLEKQELDVVSLLRQVVDLFQPVIWKSRKVEVMFATTSEPIMIYGDANRFKQILINLIRNGAEHTLPGGIVRLSTRCSDEQVFIDVYDTGEGICEEDLPHIWDHFYRGSAANKPEGGSGLGLTLVKELAEVMGGAVAVQSEVGRGSCFTVCFPLVVKK
jgi:signal transduction histidine kinase